MTQSPERLRIAYLSRHDPRDRRSSSGTVFSMVRALQEHCGDVTVLGSPSLHGNMTVVERFFEKASRSYVPGTRLYDQSLPAALRYGEVGGRMLRSSTFDVAFVCNDARIGAFLRTDLPVVFASDMTWRHLWRDYPRSYRAVWLSNWERDFVERRVIRRSRALIYPSAWAAQSAIAHYGAAPSRVYVVPFGPNLEVIPPTEVALDRSLTPNCRLLFLGLDWERKGGPIAYDATVRLRDAGIDAELVVCGCTPPSGYADDWITVIPFLDKNRVEDRERFAALLRDASFLLLPTRAECFGMVFCEASAYGLPSITTDTGGVSGAVRQGVNGYLLPKKAGGEAYAQVIESIYRDGGAYEALVRGSRREYDERLNWDVWGRRVRELMLSAMAEGGKR
jgi:glycosyltransferase involved in cell wall biosynthesis